MKTGEVMLTLLVPDARSGICQK